MNTKILGVLALILVTGGIAFGIFQSTKNATENPNTNFNPATVDNSSSDPNPGGKVAAGYVAGHVRIGPNCPGPEIEDKPCQVPPEAYSSREVIVYDSDGITVNVEGKIDTSGNYKIPLGPGKYFIQIQPAGIGPGEKKSVTIESWQTSVVDFDIDTGIR